MWMKGTDMYLWKTLRILLSISTSIRPMISIGARANSQIKRAYDMSRNMQKLTFWHESPKALFMHMESDLETLDVLLFKTLKGLERIFKHLIFLELQLIWLATSIYKDHYGNKRNHFLSFCAILGIGWRHRTLLVYVLIYVLYVYVYLATLCIVLFKCQSVISNTTTATNEDSNQTSHRLNMIRVFVVCMKKRCILDYPK